ncbi:MAG: hypothetical protein OEZ43_08335 [Gammaproteobacteria bacterium]|nr:hypothetical protein [Gammaproteobacteria bacterium]
MRNPTSNTTRQFFYRLGFALVLAGVSGCEVGTESFGKFQITPSETINKDATKQNESDILNNRDSIDAKIEDDKTNETEANSGSTDVVIDATIPAPPETVAEEPEIIKVEPESPDLSATMPIAKVRIQNLRNSAQASIPITFGHIFHEGQVSGNAQLSVVLIGETIQQLQSQFDKKAFHTDTSLRHAIVTFMLPSLAPSGEAVLELRTALDAPQSTPISIQDILNSQFDGKASVTIDGIVHTASVKDALRNGLQSTWINGSLASEWISATPLVTAEGVEHPHLTARFYVRAYTGLQSIRVDYVIENNWAYVPGPQNFTYDVQLELCGKRVYEKTGLTHYHHARWRKTLWCGEEPDVHVKHDVDYLIDSKAVPNYDRSIVIPEQDLQAMDDGWSGEKIEPMGIGVANAYMPATGANPAIGPLPRWSVRYLLSQDYRAKTVMLGTDSLAGSWSIHYRDKNTNLSVSLDDYPYMTLKGTYGDTRNPVTGKHEAFPACAGECASLYTHDVAHHPSLGYLPYIVTGDYYLLEELQFWSNYLLFQSNPHFREFGSGLFKQEQVRGQAWALRTLGHAAYITPDANPMKEYFTTKLTNNINWYNSNYSQNDIANPYGVITNGYALVYNDGKGIAPWMDDFFTWSTGNLVDLGFTDASTLLKWKSRFPIGRMTNPGYCWLFASSYSLNLRASQDTPIYSTWLEIYTTQFAPELTSNECNSLAMAEYRQIDRGVMEGYPYSPTGYPSNLQIALAAVDNSVDGAQKAWDIFQNRTAKPDYSRYPNFAIVPR